MQAGIAYATDQIIDLISNGVRGIHIYTMNKPEIAKAIEALGEKFAGEGRVLIRPSGTEPLVRVMIEGKDQKMIDEEAKKLADLIQQTML